MMYDKCETYTMKEVAAHRKHEGDVRLTRMNLMLNRDDLQRLKDIYGVRTESEAVRKACALAVLADEADRLAEWTAAHGGLDDVYGRTTRSNQLPHEWPEDEPMEEDLDGFEETPPAPASTRRRR